VAISCGISIVCNICEELPVKNQLTARQYHAIAGS